MDDRQKQLVAAAEAMRTWVHAQRALWTSGYPRTLPPGQPQLAVAGAGAAAAAVAVPMFPRDVVSEPDAAPAEPWAAETESRRSWWAGISERVIGTAQGTTTFVRTSWRMLAAIAGIVLLVGAVRVAWPGMKTRVSSNLAEGRDLAASQKEPSSQKPAADRASGATAGNAAATAGTAKGFGRLQVESNPAGAHVLVDGKDRGVTPLTVEGLADGSHKVVIRADDGSVQRNVSIIPGQTVQLSESIYSGWLHVSAPFEIQLSEGSKPITLDDRYQVLLSPGPHDIRIENRALGLRQVRHIDIRPGETTAISVETPTSQLTVTSSEPATVSVDGTEVGETPLTGYVIPIGTRDVTVTSASGAVRHQMITVKVEPFTLDIDFSKP